MCLVGQLEVESLFSSAVVLTQTDGLYIDHSGLVGGVKHGTGGQTMNEDRCICCMVKHPCQGCIYFKVCGENTRTAPCYGRKTKRDERKNR